MVAMTLIALITVTQMVVVVTIARVPASAVVLATCMVMVVMVAITREYSTVGALAVVGIGRDGGHPW